MAGYFIIQLKTETLSGKKKKMGYKYVVVDSQRPTMRVVNSKSSATRFQTHGIASLVSDHFWEHCWERFKEQYNLDTREVIFVKSRG